MRRVKVYYILSLKTRSAEGRTESPKKMLEGSRKETAAVAKIKEVHQVLGSANIFYKEPKNKYLGSIG